MSKQESEMPWLNNYPNEVPPLISELEHSNLGNFIESFCCRYDNLPAFSQFYASITYGELWEDVRSFACALQNLGYQKGDRIALMMPNILIYPIALYACFLTGVIAVNVNPLYTPSELRYQLNDSDVSGIIIAEPFMRRFSLIEDKLPHLQDVILVKISDGHSFFEKMALNLVLKKINNKTNEVRTNHAWLYSELLKEGKKHILRNEQILGKDIALLQYTGGTTGVPKGAIITHNNLLSNVEQISQWFGYAIKEKSLISIVPLPLYHIFSLTVNLLCLPRFGFNNHLIIDPRDTNAFIKYIKKKKFSLLCGVNTLFRELLDHEDINDVDFSELKFTISGGMRLEREIAERWREVTGNNIIEGYGLTEASPIVSVNLLNQNTSEGVGYPLPNTQVRICDSDAQVLKIGDTGELWVKGPQVMRGYWLHPDESSRVLTADKWLKTGDIAQIDPKGFIRIVDRKKDMIIVSGFNVYPSEIEYVLKKNPAIDEVAVIGIPDQNTGEKIVVFIKFKENMYVHENELRNLVRKHLTNYKRPKIYKFVSTIPKTAVGKIAKLELLKLIE